MKYTTKKENEAISRFKANTRSLFRKVGTTVFTVENHEGTKIFESEEEFERDLQYDQMRSRGNSVFPNRYIKYQPKI